MDIKKKSSRGGIKIVIIIIVLLILLSPGAIFLFSCAKMFLHIDLSQNYRKVEGVEDIIFCSHNQLYKRTFWGLKAIDGQMDLTNQDKEEQKARIEELKQFIHCENIIDAAIPSADGRYILYREINANYFKSDMTDDEYCYYRIYDTNTKKIITVYKGYREWFDLSWQ